MTVPSAIDTTLDRSIALGYGAVGYSVRSRLPTWPRDLERMDGKVVLVTGAGSGIGLAAAAGFATLGASVRVLGRSTERAEEAARLARERARGADPAALTPVVCDVSSLAALRSFTARFLEQEDRLDVLVNNAGIMPDARELSRDGVELTFATHVLATWFLTEALTPLLRRAAPSRVLAVTSGGQYGQRLPAGDPESAHTPYRPKTVYARTKRAQLVLTEQWAERLRGSGIHVHAMHPGWADTKGVRTWMPLFRRLTGPFIRSPEQGADTLVWLGSSPQAVRTTGLFWHDRLPRPTTYAAGPGPDPEEARRELWDYVAALAGQPAGR